MRGAENCMAFCFSASRSVIAFLQSVNWSLHALRIYVAALNAIDTTTYVSKKTYLALSNAVNDEQYIFFKNDPVPYPLQKVVSSGPATCEPKWTYNLTKNTFTASNRSGRYVKLPWLSAVIKYNDMRLYSLDEFVDTVRFSESNGIPPDAQTLLSAWSLFTGNVLDKNLEMNLLIIDGEGNEERFVLHKKPFFIEELDEVQMLPDLEAREETT